MTSRLKIKRAEPNADGLKDSDVPKRAERRRAIIRAAYQTLAEKGFEGLRMREIAKRAGLNHATLHYYFAGKEALIDGVLDHIVQELSIGRGPGMENLGPRQRLVAHFEELIRQARQQPEMFVVLAEINARSMRDPAVHSVVAKNDRGWKRFLMEILQEGIRKKEFQAWLDADTAAEAIISLVRGLSVTCAGRADAMERPLRQLAAWLVVK